MPVPDRHGHSNAFDSNWIKWVCRQQTHQAGKVAGRRLVNGQGIVIGVGALDVADFFGVYVHRNGCHGVARIAVDLGNGRACDGGNEPACQQGMVNDPDMKYFIAMNGLIVDGNSHRNHLRHRANHAADGERPVLKDAPDGLDRRAELERCLVRGVDVHDIRCRQSRVNGPQVLKRVSEQQKPVAVAVRHRAGGVWHQNRPAPARLRPPSRAEGSDEPPAGSCPCRLPRRPGHDMKMERRECRA